MNEVSVTELDKYIIIDTHGGEEDILGLVAAIQLAKKYHKIILGITCVSGRRPMEKAVEDALIAQQITRSSIPVFKGSQLSMQGLSKVCFSGRNTRSATIFWITPLVWRLWW
jgi:inosine-uridine nucleoside N-ribohydrolase